MRIVKYRGTAHGTNEYPFLIDEDGFSVLPVSSLGLNHQVFEEAISSGVPDLDAMLSSGGFYRGSSILVSGVAGSGKSSLSASFVGASAARGEKAIYFSFEESREQTVRNMRSIGLDLAPLLENGLVRHVAARPTFYSLEMHLAIMVREIQRFDPKLVVLDPISAFMESGDPLEVQSMLLRMVDFLKNRGITGVFTHLMHRQDGNVATDAGLSSLMDAWVLMLNREVNGEFNRELYLLKARGVSHSNQVREFIMSGSGIKLLPPYLGENGALTGSARRTEEARARRAEMDRLSEVERLRGQIEVSRRKVQAQIDSLRAEVEAGENQLRAALERETAYRLQSETDKAEMETSRRV